MLAAAHARADEDFDPAWVPVSIDRQIDALAGGDREGFRDLVWQRASSYAKQVVKDYDAFRATMSAMANTPRSSAAGT